MDPNNSTIAHGRVKPGMFPGISFEAGDNFVDPDTLDDEALDAHITGGGSAPATAEPEPIEEPPAGEQAAEGDTGNPPGSAAQPGEEKQPEEQQPRMVPLPELIETRRRAQAAEQELRRVQEERERAQAAEQEAQRQQELRENLKGLDPEDAALYLEEVRKIEQREAQQQLAEQQTFIRAEYSENAARKLYGEEYDAQLTKLYQNFGVETVQQMAFQQQDPGEWVVQTGRMLMTPEEREKAIDAQVEKKVQEALAKNQPPAPRGHNSVGHAASETQPPPVTKDPDDMSDDELEAAIAARKVR